MIEDFEIFGEYREKQIGIGYDCWAEFSSLSAMTGIQEPEFRSQESEVRSQKSEFRIQKSGARMREPAKLSSQFRLAALSIAVNIAVGFRKRGITDKLRL